MEIKVRAWNKEKSIMVYECEDNEGGYQWEGMTVNSVQMVNGRLMYDAEYEWMLYIGVKDKNDKRVYVGDIVKCTRGCPHEVIFTTEHGGTFGGGMPAFYLSGLGRGYAWTGEEEVIGNIFEHKHLLEE